MITRWLYTGGVAAIGVGMALVYAAVIMRGVFIPGALLILGGMVACAAGMVTDVMRPSDEMQTAAAPRRHAADAARRDDLT